MNSHPSKALARRNALVQFINSLMCQNNAVVGERFVRSLSYNIIWKKIWCNCIDRESQEAEYKMEFPLNLCKQNKADPSIYKRARG